MGAFPRLFRTSSTSSPETSLFRELARRQSAADPELGRGASIGEIPWLREPSVAAGSIRNILGSFGR